MLLPVPTTISVESLQSRVWMMPWPVMWVSPFFACAAGAAATSVAENATTLTASDAPDALQPTVVPFATTSPRSACARLYVAECCRVGRSLRPLSLGSVCTLCVGRSDGAPRRSSRRQPRDGRCGVHADRRRRRRTGRVRPCPTRTAATDTSTTAAGCCTTTRSRICWAPSSMVKPFSGAVCQYVLSTDAGVVDVVFTWFDTGSIDRERDVAVGRGARLHGEDGRAAPGLPGPARRQPRTPARPPRPPGREC